MDQTKQGPGIAYDIGQEDIPPVDTLCDFCNQPLAGDEAWAWPCSTFIVREIAFRCWGDWDACPPCHRLLRRNDARLLFQRIVKMFMLEGDRRFEADMR